MLKKSAKNLNDKNYQPQYVTQAFKVIKGQAVKLSERKQESLPRISNGLESEINDMTLVQLPAIQLENTVKFYVEVLGLSLEHPERSIERNTFLQTLPRIGPGLHILETPELEFRHLHGTLNGELEEYLAFYAKNLNLLHERLMHNGAEIVTDPTDGYMSFFDPGGHLIGVYERTDGVINDQFASNITGFRHVQMHVADLERTALFFENVFGLERVLSDKNSIYLAVSSSKINLPMIRLVQAADPAIPQPMQWILDGSPKHALELHSKNIGVLMERVLENGGVVKEDLEFTGCGGYLKFFTPDGHYIWVNQDRIYCEY